MSCLSTMSTNMSMFTFHIISTFMQLKNGYSEELELSSLLVKLRSSQGDTASSLAVRLHSQARGS